MELWLRVAQLFYHLPPSPVIPVKTEARGRVLVIIIHHSDTNVLIHANTETFNGVIRQHKQLMSHCNRKEMLMKNFNESLNHEWNKLKLKKIREERDNS